MPFGVGEAACGFCDQEADGPLHSSATPLEFVAKPFARSLRAKARLLHAGLTPRQDARLRESLSDDIENCDIVTPDLRPPEVSAAALAAAPEGIVLYREAWHSQPRFDPGRAVFHVEHVVPVRSLREDCIAATTEDAVVGVLAGIRVAWILKSEDRELSRLGYRTLRDRPDEAYREAGIELVPWYRYAR
jgi:hypothetical protein